jgi:hypothetical protein
MSQLRLCRPASAALAGCIVLGLGGITSASAGIITASPSLPLLDVPYASSIDAGCFSGAGVCVSAGTLTLTSEVSSTFDGTGQEIVVEVTYAAVLTNLFGVAIGPVDLTGTMNESVVGRTTNSDTGIWDTEETALSVIGTALGDTLSMTQDPDNGSTGSTSIASNGDGTYLVTSFFDMFVDLSLGTGPPQTTAQGPIFFDVSVPEPSSLALLAVALMALAFVRRRR